MKIFSENTKLHQPSTDYDNKASRAAISNAFGEGEIKVLINEANNIPVDRLRPKGVSVPPPMTNVQAPPVPPVTLPVEVVPTAPRGIKEIVSELRETIASLSNQGVEVTLFDTTTNQPINNWAFRVYTAI